ncbi:MAG: LysE family translocator [Rikenellaceae bacterium]
MPGPDIIFVLTESIKNGVKNGVKIACGLSTGLAVYSIIVLTGLGLIISRIGWLNIAVKYFGVCYLMFIGISSVRAAYKNSKTTNDNFELKNEVGYNPYIRGIIMNLTNPKTLIFFLSLFPQFMDMEKSPILESILLFVILIGIALTIFSLVAIFSGKISAYLKANTHSFNNSGKFFAFLELAIFTTISLFLLFE